MIKELIGKILADEKESNKRMNICKNCPRFIKETKRCNPKIIDGKKGCNCFMEIKTKILNAKCPIGEW